ncbi:hypothetical protein ACFL1H_00590 [Nanoarchaeota archaeon]
MGKAKQLIMGDKYEIKVGEERDLKLGFLSGVKIIYCGKPNPAVFSIANYREDPYSAAAVNIYYSTDKRDIKINGHKFNVAEVDADKIILEYVK